MALLPHRLRTPLSYVLILGLLGAVYVLPADTSLAEVRRAGILRACLPPLYPPLVTGQPDRPGIDVELLRALADTLRVTLVIASNPAMGGDFNPRNWRITRAQCEVLAGGVVASATTRSFLDTSAPYAQTGWAFVLPKPIGDLNGSRAGVFTGISGLDRIALSRFLRDKAIDTTVVANADELVDGLRQGRFDVGVTEALLAGQIAAREGWMTQWAPELPRYPVVLGLWKGDLTLKRAIADGLAQLDKRGEIERILARYRSG